MPSLFRPCVLRISLLFGSEVQADCRGKCQFRGVTKHHQQGKYEARIGRVSGNKYLYLVFIKPLSHCMQLHLLFLSSSTQ